MIPRYAPAIAAVAMLAACSRTGDPALAFPCDGGVCDDADATADAPVSTECWDEELPSELGFLIAGSSAIGGGSDLTGSCGGGAASRT